MLQVTIATCVIILVGVDNALSDERSANVDTLNDGSERRLTREVDTFLTPQDSRGFGYSVESDDQQSSHFRKEQRDLNGVVRGSYGLKDPNGSFRLVRYIADDKGFRAHISSNERGVGRQNPASVRINRFSGAEFGSRDVNPPDTLFSIPTQQDDKYIPENQDFPSNYNFYTPVNSRINVKDESQRKPGPLDLRKHLLTNRFIDQVSRIKENQPTGSTGSFLWPNNNYGSQNHRVFDDGIEYFDKNTVPPNNPRRGEYGGIQGNEDYNSYPRLSSGSPTNIRDIGDVSSHLGNDNLKFKKVTSGINAYDDGNMRIPPNVLKLLLYQPQQKVHTTLPDCDRVSSAVLCKPPLVYTTNYLQYNSTEKRLNSPNGRLGDNSAFRSFRTNERRQRIETTLAERLYRFAMSNDEAFPSHTLPNTFAQDDNVKREHPNLKQFSQTPCAHEHKPNSGSLSEDLTVTNSLNRPVIYNTISNTQISSLMKYGGNWNEPLSNTGRSNYELLNHPQFLRQNALASQTGSSKVDAFSNHEKFILLASQNEKMQPDNPILSLFKNMNILGFIILPKEKSHDESVKNFDNNLPKASTFTSSTNSNNGDPSDLKHNFEDIQGETKPDAKASTEISNPYAPDVDSASATISKHTGPNFSIDKPSIQSKDTPKDGHLDSKIQLNNSQFLILDDTNNHRNQYSEHSLDETNTNETKNQPMNWRKIFEEEIKEEHEKTLKHPSNHTDIESHSNTSRNSGIPNERVYNLNEPQIPLYDSRGFPINSENVPLHLHRYVQPTGLPTFPWKFAIPRPAPPRSLVIPPKPLGLS